MRSGRKSWFYSSIPVALVGGLAFFAFDGKLLSKHQGQVFQGPAERMRIEQLEQSRTHETRLLPSDFDRESALSVLSEMKSLSELSPDGLRFVAIPSSTVSYYGVVLTLESTQATEAAGVLSIFYTGGSGATDIEERKFSMPTNEYRALTAKIDRLTDAWPGESGFACIDGTTTAFERVRGKRITSGTGSCGRHYGALRSIMLEEVRKFAPGGDLPAQDDWRRPPPVR
jgi:hypothetical protein